MHKIEKIIFGLLGLFYLNKSIGAYETPGFVALNILVFLTISISGFKIYRFPTYKDKTKAILFAIYCGLAFSLGIISFGSKIWQQFNYIAIILALPNFILFSYLIFCLWKNRIRKTNKNEKHFKGLLARSSVILFICVLVISLPHTTLNKYINRDVPMFYNMAISEEYYNEAQNHFDQGDFKKSLAATNLCLETAKYVWGDDTVYYRGVYKLLYKVYFELIKQNHLLGEFDKVLEYSEHIKNPIQIYFGDSSKQEAYVKTLAGEAYQHLEDYEASDSVYIEAMSFYKAHFGTKNIFYATTLQLLANSYRERYYYSDAIDLYNSVIQILKDDSTEYTSSSSEKKNFLLENAIANAYSEMAWTYSLKDEYDTADKYFDKTFSTETYSAHKNYPEALLYYAFHTFYKGDYHNAKTLMEKGVDISLKAYGELHYSYLEALDGLSSINTTLAKYDKAEELCLKAIETYNNISDEKNEYYGSLLSSLAQIKHYTASYDTAAHLYNEALIYTKENSRQYADILESTSKINSDLTNYTIALSQAKQSSKIAENYFENDSPYITSYYKNEAYMNYLNGNYNEAEILYKKCFSIDTTHNNQGKISFASTLNGIGLIMKRRRKFIEADTLFDNALTIYKNQIGENHPDYAIVLYNKGNLKLGQEKLEEAEVLFKQAIEILRKVFTEKHDNIADNYTGLGEIELKRQNYQLALDYFKKANIIYKEKFNSEHKKVALTSSYIERYTKMLN